MIKPRLISISGSVHSGKTTISRMIATAMPNAFYLDGDLISSLVNENYPSDTGIDDTLPEVHEKIIQLVGAGLRNNVDVIIDYPISDNVRQQIVEALSSVSFEPKWFLLKPDIEKVLQGSAHRPELNDWEIERVKYQYSGQIGNTEIAKVIDSTNQTPNETFKTIMEDLK